METTEPLNARRSVREETLAFFMHSAFAAICGSFLAGIVSSAVVRFFSVLGVHHISGILTEILGPFFWLTVITLGFLVNSYMCHRSAPWIGAIGILSIAVILIWDHAAVGQFD